MKYLLSTLLATLFCSSIFSQSFKSNYSFTAGNTGSDQIQDITTDAQGNIYITGSFTDSVDFDPGPGTYYLTTPMGNKPDAFIQKLDANGNFLWAKSFRGTYNDIEIGQNIAVDDTGNVYMSGSYQRNIFFTPNGTQWPGNSNSNVYQPFLVKLDSTGNVKWGMGWKGNYTTVVVSGVTYFRSTYFYDLTLDEAGNVYLTGLLRAWMDFDPTPNKNLTKSSVGESDVCVLKVSNSGDVEKVVCAGGALYDWANTIAYNNGHIVTGGSFLNTVDFNPDTNTVNQVTSTGSNESFIWRLDTALNFVSIASFGGPSVDYCIAFDHDNQGNLYNVGHTASSTIDIDPDPNNSLILNSNNYRIYLQKLDTAGNLLWAKLLLAGSWTARATDLSVNSQNEISISGFFGGTADADPDPNNTFNLVSQGGNDAFVLKLDSTGNFISAASFGGTDDDTFESTFLSDNSSVYAGGSFQNTIDIDPTANTNFVTSNGQKDMLFVELGLCTLQEDTLPVTVCNYFVVPGDTVQNTTSGFYTGNYFDVSGCDSTVVFVVFVRNFAVGVIQTIDGLVASNNGSNPTYQWLDCSTGQPIAGATNQIFMPTANGQYAAIVSDSLCTDTSTCYTINNVSIAENSLPHVALYPNPTTGLLQIKASQEIQKIQVHDLVGREIFSIRQPENQVDLSALNSGIYLIKVWFDEGVVVRRVVRE